MNPAISMAMGSGGTVTPTYSDDVFASYTYTGNGTGSQTISIGIDLVGKGGMVWIKSRTNTEDHHLTADPSGGVSTIFSNLTNAAANYTCSPTYTSTGYTLSGSSGGTVGSNTSGQNYTSWIFRKAAKFFDVVNGTGPGTFNHSLSTTPQCIILKTVGATGAWRVSHVGLTGGMAGSKIVELNNTGAEASSGSFSPTSTTFSPSYWIGGGTSWVAYLFADDTSADGLVRCSSFTCDGSGNATVSLGWEPQFLLVKASSTSGDWIMLDIQRGWDTNTTDAKLLANTNGAETTATNYGEPTSSGFNFKGGTASATYIFVAIRRSNKPPTTGTQVFNAATRTGTGATAVSASSGFPVDLFMTKKRSSTTLTAFKWFDRLRGKTLHIDSSSNAVEATTSDSVTAMDSMDGVTFGADTSVSAFNTSGHTYVDYFLKRAVGVLDVVHYIGTAAAQTVSHNLNAVPELMIVKPRDAVVNWYAYHKTPGATQWALVSGTGGFSTASTIWNNTTPTTSVFSVGTGLSQSATKYIAYLFATVAGVSKVGSYTGNGTSLNIDCGFAAGARFVMIKRSDSTGDWIIFDTVRGIIAGNDPWFALNTTAAEVTTDDSIDPYSLGFTVNQVAATNVNVSSGNYIFLAIA